MVDKMNMRHSATLFSSVGCINTGDKTYICTTNFPESEESADKCDSYMLTSISEISHSFQD